MFFFFLFFAHIYFPASGQAVVTGVATSFPQCVHALGGARIIEIDHSSQEVNPLIDDRGRRSFFSFFSHTSTFQLLDKPWSQVSSLLPPGFCLHFLSRIGFSNPAARRFFIEFC